MLCEALNVRLHKIVREGEVLQITRRSILPRREWEVLERLAIRGPLNADKIAKSRERGEPELPPSTMNKCVTRLLSDHFIRPQRSQTWRKREVPYYSLSQAGLSLLLTSEENWGRLQEIFRANSQLFNSSSRQRLLNAWELTYGIPPERTEHVMDYYYWYLRVYLQVERRHVSNEMRELARLVMEKIPPDPYTLLLNALVRCSLSEIDPHLMFEVQLEKKRTKESHVKSVLADDETVQKKLRFPDWFRTLLRKAYMHSFLYMDLIAMMKWVRDESKAQAAIVSQELRRLRSIESSIHRELEMDEISV